MAVLLANNATTTLAADINSSATSIAVAATKGELFPAINTAGNYFYATLVNQQNDIEIIKCTARAGDVLTVERGQDGTLAQDWLAGDVIEMRINRAVLHDIQAGIPVPVEEEPEPVVGVLAGMIVMWSGAASAIPAGWALCDGTNGTPDLRSKFVIGAGAVGAPYQVAAQGGAAGGTTGEGGSHTHSGSTDTQGAHAHGGNTGGRTLSEAGLVHLQVYAPGTQHGAFSGSAGASHSHAIGSDGQHQHSISIGYASSHTHSFSALPPYYALCFIMKV